MSLHPAVHCGDMSAALEFRSVSVFTAQERPLLEGISLTVDAGTTAILLGRSGSGKTTLLRTVNAMIVPAQGEVLVNGTPNSDPSSP